MADEDAPAAPAEDQLEDDVDEEDKGEQEPSDGESMDSSEEEEDEDNNEYENDGFVVDEAAEEEGGEGEDGEDAVRKRRKKPKKRKSLKLDEEDYDLLEENQVKVRRPTGRKRLKRAGEGQAKRPTDAEEMRAELFGGDEELEDELEDDEAPGPSGRAGAGVGREGRGRGGGAEREQRREEDEELLDDDEMGDFIVDEGNEGAKRRQARRAAGAMPGLDARAFEEAVDIFGNVDELLQIYQEARAGRAPDVFAGVEQELQLEEEELAEGEEEDEEAMERRRQQQEDRRRQLLYQRAMKVLDPETIAAQYLKPEDQAIKERDFPERLQLLGIDNRAEPLDVATATDWIFEQLFKVHESRHVQDLLGTGILEVDGSTPPPHPEGWRPEELFGGHRTMQLGGQRAVRKDRQKGAAAMWRNNEEQQAQLKESIRQVLVQMYEKGEEVPLIAMYRKEMAGELLALREEDMPAFTTYDDLNGVDHRKRDIYEPGMVQAKHRKIRRFEALWYIFSLSLRFRKVVRRRAALSKRLEGAAELLLDAVEGDRRGLEELAKSMDSCWTDEGLADVEAKLRLLTDAHGVTQQLQAMSLSQGPNARQQRAPAVHSLYRKSREAGLQALASQVLLTPEQFVGNIDDSGAPQCEPNDPNLAPVEWLERQLTEEPALRDVLGAVSGDDLRRKLKMYAMQELAAEPGVRVMARSLYMNSGKVSTAPTSAGEHHSSLDPWAKYGVVKRLEGKPFEAFAGSDQFVRIQGALKDGLITLTIGADTNMTEGELYKREPFKQYCSANVATVSKAWNDFRAEIVRDCLLVLLFPVFEREIKQRLLAEAKEVALQDLSSKIWALAARPPLRLISENDDGEVVVDQPRVMAAVWGPGEKGQNQTGPPTVLVLLDERGALVDLLPCGQLSGQIPKSGKSVADVFKDERKKTDVNRIKDKILNKPPHAILVGASDPATTQLHEDLQRICEHIFDEHSRDMRDLLETGIVEVKYGDERLAALWESCRAAKEEFPEQPAHVRRAIALGRLSLDPLAVLSQLCGPGREVLGIKASVLQDLLSPDERMAAIEQVLVTAVSQVGVDINLAANVAWRRDALQFVPGLGPRKARALLEAVQRNGSKVESRNEMYRELGVLGKTVFRNCGSFLRVTSAHLPQLANLEFRQLDASRVHPESYRLAVGVCEKASGEEDVEAAVEECADKIERLDLVSLAAEKEVPAKLTTLIDIRHELLAPGAELRGSFQHLSDREVFLLQYGESEDTLREGRLVEAKIVYVGRDFVRCRLAHTPIEAMVTRDNLSSRADASNVNLRDVLARDQAIQGRIIRLSFEESDRDGTKHHVLELTTRRADLQNFAYWETKYCKSVDGYYKIASETGGGAARGSTTPSRATPSAAPARRDMEVVPRPIKHPLFQNISLKKANELLAEEERAVGDCIIRPAQGAKGSIMLAVSIKLYHGGIVGPIIHNLDVVEAEKKPGPAAHLQLKTPLQIDLTRQGMKEVMSFEDLDELHAAFVEPLMSRVKDVTMHRKFRDELKSKIDEAVVVEKKQNPQTNPYAIGVEVGKSGVAFFISFATGTSAHHDYFLVTPEGLYFRSKLYKDVERVLSAFKADPFYKRGRGNVHNPGATAAPQWPLPPQMGGYASQSGAGPSGQQQAPPYMATEGYGGGGYSGQGQVGAYSQSQGQGGYAPAQSAGFGGYGGTLPPPPTSSFGGGMGGGLGVLPPPPGGMQTQQWGGNMMSGGGGGPYSQSQPSQQQPQQQSQQWSQQQYGSQPYRGGSQF